MADARISLPFRSGVIEIEGSEDFVREHLKKFEQYIDEALQQTSLQAPDRVPANPVPQHNVLISSSDEYGNVLEVNDGTIHIISDIPGASKKQQTINAALLCLLGAKISGMNEVSFEPIRDVCRNHGFLDSTNFAKYLKSDRSLFVISGSSKNQTVKLSQPGYRKAVELAEELNNA